MTPRPIRLADALPHVQDGDLLLSVGTKAYSRVIQHWSRSIYSHALVAFWVRTDTPARDRLWVVHSMEPGGVRTEPAENVLRRGDRVDWFALVDGLGVCREALVDHALAQVGRGYANPKQFFRSWSVVWSRVKRWRGKPADTSAERYFCSELAAECYRVAGYRHDEPAEPCETDPGMLARYTCVRRMGTLSL